MRIVCRDFTRAHVSHSIFLSILLTQQFALTQVMPPPLGTDGDEVAADLQSFLEPSQLGRVAQHTGEVLRRRRPRGCVGRLLPCPCPLIGAPSGCFGGRGAAVGRTRQCACFALSSSVSAASISAAA